MFIKVSVDLLNTTMNLHDFPYIFLRPRAVLTFTPLRAKSLCTEGRDGGHSRVLGPVSDVCAEVQCVYKVSKFSDEKGVYIKQNGSCDLLLYE